MLRKLLLPASVVLALSAIIPTAQGHVRSYYSNPDFYILIPPSYELSCDEARSLLEQQGYKVSKTIHCGGNYHKFKAQRGGFKYIVGVMTSRGKSMIDARSN